MSKSPFYKIYVGKDANEEISDLIESFVYEDAMGEDSLLRITVKDNYSLSMADDARLSNGKILTFQFGYLSGEISELHQARITDVKTKYRDRITLDITALDIGTTMRKVEEQKIWKKVTSSQIAQEIAAKYGLTFEGEATTKVWDSIPQGNKSDMKFLRYLADREETGNYTVYIRNSTLYFIKRGTDKNSVLTFTYGDAERVVLFEPTIKESSVKGDANASITSVYDPYKGAYKTETVDNTSEHPAGTLGSHKYVYRNGQSADTGKRITIKDVKPQSQTVNPTPSTSEAKNLGNSKTKKAKLKSLVAKLVVEGSPLLTPNNVITMKGVAKVHSGNWLIDKVTHTISNGGYLSSMDLTKNGRSDSKAPKAKDANKSVGANKSEDKVKLIVRDGQSRKVGYSSKDRNAKKNDG